MANIKENIVSNLWLIIIGIFLFITGYFGLFEELTSLPEGSNTLALIFGAFAMLMAIFMSDK